jgi:hypothetical protein
VSDARRLANDIISPEGAMGHVRDLLNIWAVFVASNTVRTPMSRLLACVMLTLNLVGYWYS